METQDLLNKKCLVDRYLAESPCDLSAFSFVNIFSWKDFFTFDFEIIDDNLCVFATHSLGTFLYLPPLGRLISSEAIKECFRRLQGDAVFRIENVLLSMLCRFPSSAYAYFRKSCDYVYLKQEIVNLRGNRYKSKRSSYNYCAKNYFCHYIHFESSMIPECVSLYRQWVEQRKTCHDSDIYCHMLEENMQVHQLVMKNYQELDLVGRVVVVGDSIKAYTFGFVLNSSTFCVLFEIADLSIHGLATYIFRSFCHDDVWKKYTWVNVMDDFEMENIAKSKMSFHPAMLIPSYSIKKKV